MTDSGPGAVLRSLVDRAVDADGSADGAADGGEGWAVGHRVVVAERGGDPEPVDALASVVGGEEAEPVSIVGVVPRIDAPTLRRLRDAIDEAETDRTVRLVFTGAAAERLSGGSGAVLRPALARHGVEATVHDGDSPIAVLLVGERAVVGLVDDDGLAALLSTDAPGVRSWAAGVYRRYAADAAAGPSGDGGSP